MRRPAAIAESTIGIVVASSAPVSASGSATDGASMPFGGQTPERARR